MTPTDAQDEAAKTVAHTRVPRSPAAAAWIALLVGLASAFVSAYWGAGGEGLLDTVGGAFERLGCSRSGGAVFLLSIVVVVKVIAAILPLLAIREVRSSPTRRLIRRLAWVEAFILTGYGLAYLSVGSLVPGVGSARYCGASPFTKLRLD